MDVDVDGNTCGVIPDRLVPYLGDLVATGLYGYNEEQAVVRMVEEGIRRAVVAGVIRVRGGEGS